MAIITQEDLRLYANIGVVSGSVSGSTEASGVLQIVVDGCNAAAESYCGRTFSTASHTDITDGDGRRSAVTREQPLVSVTTLRVWGAEVTESVSGSAGYYLDQGVVRLRWMEFPRGRDNVEITYVAGYAEVPADVRLAVMKWAAGEYFNRLKDGSTGYPISMPDAVKQALDPYRRVF